MELNRVPRLFPCNYHLLILFVSSLIHFIHTVIVPVVDSTIVNPHSSLAIPSPPDSPLFPFSLSHSAPQYFLSLLTLTINPFTVHLLSNVRNYQTTYVQIGRIDS